MFRSSISSRFLIVFFVFIVLLSIFNCTKKQESIKIGAIFDLTGSLSYMGQWSLKGALIALDEINAQGGVNDRRIELVVEDAETKPDKAVSAFQKLISKDMIKVAIGFNGSSEVMACAPTANNTKTVLFSSGGASPRITDAGDYVFRNRLSGAIEVEEMANIIYNKLGLRNIGILYINNDYGEGYKDVFEKHFKELGGKILFLDAFDQDKTDFRVQLTKLKNLKNLEGIYLIPYVKEGAHILKQAKELDLNIKWFSANAIEGPELFDIAGDAAEGLMYTVAKYDPHDSLAMGFNKKYRERYGEDSEMFAANAYDALKIVRMCIEKVGNDGEKIKDALYKVKDFKGASGITSFDGNGDVLKSVMVKIVKGREFVKYSE
jgi:branched-chain amino acid transport system substrate-binding protein